MKNLFYLTLIIAIFYGCAKDEQKLFVNEISGSYNISSITFTKTDLITDSVTFTNAGEFVFENCKIQKIEESYGMCPGYYIFKNEPKFNFGYLLDKSNGEDVLQVQPKNSPLPKDLFLLSTYSFSERTPKRLTLNSLSSVSSNSKFFKVRITLDRK